jgi:hypothetical protein
MVKIVAKKVSYELYQGPMLLNFFHISTPLLA